MAPPNITPHTFYGLRTDIEYNAHYITDEEIVYVAGGVIIIHNHSQKHQRFIKLVDKHRPIKSIVIAPNKRWLALNEVAETGQKPTITIYDLTTYKRKKILTIPFENTTCTLFACIQFTFDSKYLIAITGEPDWYMYYYNWEKGKVESHAKAQNPSGLGTITSVQCNPADSTLIVITGPNTFRIMNVAETVWRQWGWCKAENLNITSCMWLNGDRIFFGTENGMLMLVENGELRQNCIFRAREVTDILVKKTQAEGEEETVAKQESSEILSAEGYAVKCMVNFSKGFAYTCGLGHVFMFEKENVHKWKKRNLFRVGRNSYKHARDQPEWTPLDDIHHIAVDPAQETLLITTTRPQLYSVKLFGQHILQVPEIYFKELGSSLHHGCINSLSMCAWKPIFMTSGLEDRTIKIWNYMTDDIELIKIYQEDIYTVSLHPTGLFAVIGFSDKIRFMVVMIDDLEVMREFPIRNCKKCLFSTSGHLFAAVNGTIIQIFSTVSFQNIFNLKGHNGQITSLAWSANDNVLVSCGAEGAVYEWSTSNGHRIEEVILKANQFKACAVNSSGKTTYAVGNDGEVKEINSSMIRRNLGIIGCPLDTVILSRSDLMLFVSGGQGGIIAVQLPLVDKAIFSEYHMHNKRVVAIVLSYDDLMLISVAEDASICVWKLTNADGRAISLDKDFVHSKEILISKKDLQEKINNIELLSTRMSELETEYSYQLRQTEAAHADKMKEIHQGYGAAIDELKDKTEQMENEHTHEVGVIQQNITKLRMNHERALQNLEADFNVKLIGEYDKYQILEDKTARMRNDYEERLEDLADSKRKALREMNDSFEAKLEEKAVAIMELEEQAEMEKREHETIKASIEDDADREIIEVRTAYETQLKDEKDANVRLKGETGIMKKKLITANKDIEEFKHQVAQLRAEHTQFQKVIQALEKDILDLKKEISERDNTIQEKEKRIYELKRKNQELEKYKFVLNFKITELKNQIEPKEREIEDLRIQIEDMENEEAKLVAIKLELELKLAQLNEKLSAAKKDYLNEVDRNALLKATQKKIKIDLHNMTSNFQDPVKLKSNVKALFHKYVEDVDFVKGRVADDEAVSEFNRQRDHLERQIAALKTQLQKSVGGSKSDIGKIIDENCLLLTEINYLRSELKTSRTRCAEMESILGMSARYLTPSTAKAKLKRITEDRDRLDEKYKAKIEKCEEMIITLKEENERLLNKVRCIGGNNVAERYMS